MVVAVETEPSFNAGVPAPLFPALGYGGGRNRRYDMAPAGDRFLLPKYESNDFIVALGWFEELTERVPTN